MKNRTKLIGLVALLLAMAAFLFWLKSRGEAVKGRVEATTQVPGPPSSPPVTPLTIGATVPPPNSIQALMQTPIEFYGIVHDQEGKPVPAAKISGFVLDIRNLEPQLDARAPFPIANDFEGRGDGKTEGLPKTVRCNLVRRSF